MSSTFGRPRTLYGSQSMGGDVLGIHQLPIAGLISIEGVKVSDLGSRRRASVLLEVGGKALIQPQLPPVVTGHQIPKPLQSE